MCVDSFLWVLFCIKRFSVDITVWSHERTWLFQFSNRRPYILHIFLVFFLTDLILYTEFIYQEGSWFWGNSFRFKGVMVFRALGWSKLIRIIVFLVFVWFYFHKLSILPVFPILGIFFPWVPRCQIMFLWVKTFRWQFFIFSMFWIFFVTLLAIWVLPIKLLNFIILL